MPFAPLTIVEGVKSAEPPIILGSLEESQSKTFPMTTRVDTLLPTLYSGSPS